MYYGGKSTKNSGHIRCLARTLICNSRFPEEGRGGDGKAPRRLGAAALWIVGACLEEASVDLALPSGKGRHEVPEGSVSARCGAFGRGQPSVLLFRRGWLVYPVLGLGLGLCCRRFVEVFFFL